MIITFSNKKKQLGVIRIKGNFSNSSSNLKVTTALRTLPKTIITLLINHHRITISATTTSDQLGYMKITQGIRYYNMNNR